MNRILIALALVLSAAVAVPAMAEQGKGKSKGKRPDVIALPNGLPARGHHDVQAAHVLRRLARHGRHLQGQPAHGQGRHVQVRPQAARADDRAATGLKVDRYGRLFVSGADSQAHPRLRRPHGRRDPRLPPSDSGLHQRQRRDQAGRRTSRTPASSSCTSSRSARRARSASCRRIPITGDLVYDAGFNANGIEAAQGRQDADPRSRATRASCSRPTPRPARPKQIALTGRHRRRARQRRRHPAQGPQAARGREPRRPRPTASRELAVQLSRDLTTAIVTRRSPTPDFDVPTTIARSGGRNYVVNAKFNSASPTTRQPTRW